MSMLISLLSNDGYIILNKSVMKAIGLHEAILLGELSSEFIYWQKENKLQEGYFYSTRENIEKETTLSAHQQRQALKSLVDMNFVEVIEKDMPRRFYYKINEEKIYNFLMEIDVNILENSEVKNFDNKRSKNLMSSNEKFEQQEVKNFNVNNNNINSNNNINKNILSALISNEIMEKQEIDYGTIFKQNIEYDILMQDEKMKDLVQNITDIAVETLNSNKEKIYINGELKSLETVKSQLLKLNSLHIQYVINCLKNNTKDVKSIKSYMLTTLYNSVSTISIDATLQVARIMKN